VTSWDFAGAERAAARGLAAEPRNPIVMGNAALLYANLGRLDEAIALGERALELDPLSPVRLANLANAYLLSRRPKEAEALARRRLELLPDDPFSHFLLGDIHLVKREVDAARSSYARFVELSGAGDGTRLILQAIVEHIAGNAVASAAAAAEFERRFGAADPRAAAQIRAWRGEAEAAFAWLDQAVAVRDPAMAEIESDIYLRPLRGDPRWDELLRKVGLPRE
jgi:tetratricopeptide (TPR) repeat protein